MNDILNERIRARMSELGTNATNAALDSGLGKTAVRDILSGKTKSPTIETLGRLAFTLKCTVSYLLGDVDHPHKFRPSDEEISDVRITEIGTLLKAGIFQKPPKTLMSYGTNVMYGHPSFPEHSLSLYRMGDDSMVAAGILQNDVLTVAIPYNEEEFALYKHKFVVAVRYIVPPGLEEVSLREVAVKDGAISLITRPISDTADVIELEEQIPAKGTSNLYSTSEGHGVSIHGAVVRVTRDLPEF